MLIYLSVYPSVYLLINPSISYLFIYPSSVVKLGGEPVESLRTFLFVYSCIFLLSCLICINFYLCISQGAVEPAGAPAEQGREPDQLGAGWAAHEAQRGTPHHHGCQRRQGNNVYLSMPIYPSIYRFLHLSIVYVFIYLSNISLTMHTSVISILSTFLCHLFVYLFPYPFTFHETIYLSIFTYVYIYIPIYLG